MQVPFYRPALDEREVEEVVSVLRSGWLTTGPKVKEFEAGFVRRIKATHAIAVNSCTAALHLAAEALKLRAGQAVLVPTMTFAATAEIVRYQGAIPVLVDCEPSTLNMDLEDAARKIELLREGKLPETINRDAEIVGIMPVHVGGMMMNLDKVKEFAGRYKLWIIEDAAHAFPAAWRRDATSVWQQCGEDTATVSCFSFYANKTITTGEGGMAVTADAELAERMRLMSLHGLSHDAWGRYMKGGSWDYKIVAPGYKYNLTDIAAAIGVCQLARAEAMRLEREGIAQRFSGAFAMMDELELPPTDANRIHSWHLYPLRLRLERLSITRNEFIEELKAANIGCSVHWRPLHLHPYYEETFKWRASDCATASETWHRLVSLPIFPGMRTDEINHVIAAVKEICVRHAHRPYAPMPAAQRPTAMPPAN